MKKKAVILHLTRRLDDLTSTPDHVQMAKASMDYQARQRALDAQKAKEDKHASEIEALRSAIAYINGTLLSDDAEVGFGQPTIDAQVNA